MKPFVVYTVARFALFALVYAVFLGVYYMATDGGPVPLLWPLLLAAVVSTILSAYLLRGMRERFTEVVSDRAGRMSQRFEEMRAKGDQD